MKKRLHYIGQILRYVKIKTYGSIQITFAVYVGFILLTISFIFDHEGLQTLPMWILPMSAFCQYKI